jgi:DNA-binding beta-propeller fold protein YncE
LKRLARRPLAVLLLATAGALAVTGDITQPAGVAGCVSETGSGGTCADGYALRGTGGVAVSPDGKSVYVTSYLSTAVARFNRNTTTGWIAQPAGTAGCISETGSSGNCANGHGLNRPHAVAVSPDGKSVYVASINGDAVARFNRGTATGAITQPAGSAGCISETGAGTCVDGHALNRVESVAVSADGKSVYVASFSSDAVVRLNRDPTTGAITQPAGSAGCISETGAGPCANGHALDGVTSVAVSSDGKNVYVASFNGDAVVRLNRNPTTGAISQPAGSAGCISDTGAGTCADGHALHNPGLGPQAVAVSPDGKSVYVASYSSDAVVRLNRNPTTGAITQPAGVAGCISETGGGPCADGHGLTFPGSVVVSPDGKNVYVAASNAVARFNRGMTAGGISQPAGSAGCISETGAAPCADGHLLEGAYSVAVSADGKSVYVTGPGIARLNRAP